MKKKKENKKTKTELSKEHFDASADTYDTRLGTYASTLYDPILNLIEGSSFDRVLDLGCGTGNMIKLLSAMHPETTFYGLDLSPKMLAEAKEKLAGEIEEERVSLVEGDSEDLPYKNATMDLVICNASFHHYPHPAEALLEMRRVLKKGGTLIIGDPCPPNILGPFINKFLKHTSEYHLYSKKDFKKILKRCGFKIVSFSKPRYRRCVLMAKKKRKF